MKDKNKSPKIIIFDIETAPLLSWNWGTRDQNAIAIEKDWYMLSFAYKILGEKKVYGYKLNDFKSYKKDKENDYKLCKKLWEVLDEADIVIGHNSISFDITKSNARFIYHGFKPYSLIKNIDTYRIAKRYFKFTSNSLNNLGQHLNLGKKVPHTGFSLWKGCMNGDKKSWNLMMKYNEQDVVLTEKLYLKFLPYIQNHPNLGLYRNQDFVCPNCGSRHLHKRGFSYTKTQVYQRFQCQSCYACSQSVKSEKINKIQIKN